MSRKRQLATVSGSTRSSVDLLLADDVPLLGKRGDMVRVKPGYARNYLLPQGLATIATAHNKRLVERHERRLAELEVDRRKRLKKLAEDLSKYSVTIEANANKDGHLYGSIVATDISKTLKSAGYAVAPEQVSIEGPLKELGMYTIGIVLHAEVQTEVKVWVVPAATV